MMDEQRRQRVAEIMATIAGGDHAGIFMLIEEFPDELGHAIRRAELQHGVRLDRDEREGLIVEAAFALGEVAGAWRAEGGALPWSWARGRINALVAAHVGTSADPLQDHHLEGRLAMAPEVTHWAGDIDDDEPVMAFERLAERHPEVAQLRDVVREVGDRDLDLVLRFRIQQVQGDPAPAVTVGQALGIRPDAVRQRVSRFRRRARALITADPSLADLDGLALLCSTPPGRAPDTLAPVA